MTEHKHNHLFDPEMREKLLPSHQILMNLGIKPGHIMADLGCGFGHFSLRAAEMIGPTGKIIAVDIEPERMGILRQRAEEQGFSQRIETILVTGESISLQANEVNVALAANLLHELQNPLQYLREIERILLPEGEIWIVEWVKAETPMGPPLSERKSSEEWVALLNEAGFCNIWVQYFSPTHVLFKASKSKE